MIASSLLAILIWCVFLPFFYLLGSLAEPWLRAIEDGKLKGILYFAFGMGFFVYFLFVAGIFGFFKPLPISLLIAAILLIRIRKFPEFISWIKGLFRYFFSPGGFWLGIFQFVLGVTLLVSLSACFLPEIGNDPLVYHLNLPKLFAQSGYTHPFYYDLRSYSPLFINFLYTVGLLFQSVATAKIFHWITGVLLVASLILWLDRSLGKKALAFFIGLMLWLTPTLMNEMGTTYIDAGVSFFLFLSFCLFCIGFEKEKAPLFLAGGLLLGFGVSIKLIALVAMVPFAALFGLAFFKKPRVSVLIYSVTFFAAIFLGCGIWLARSWIFTGNPIFPYFGSFFGKEEFSLFSIYYEVMGHPKTIWSYLTLLPSIAFEPACYGYHHWAGPFYLVGFPFAIWGALRSEKARQPLLFAFIFLTLWYFIGQEMRFLLPTFSIYLIAVAVGLGELGCLYQKKALKLFTATGTILLVTMLFLLTFYHFRHQLSALGRGVSQRDYLLKMERSISIAEWVNKNLPANAKIFNAEEVRILYIDREIISKTWFARRSTYDSHKTPEAVIHFLKEKGFTHILTCRIPGAAALPGTDPLERALQDNRLTKQVVTLTSQNMHEARYEYSVYEIL